MIMRGKIQPNNVYQILRGTIAGGVENFTNEALCTKEKRARDLTVKELLQWNEVTGSLKTSWAKKVNQGRMINGIIKGA